MSIPNGVMYAQVDQAVSVQDYPPEAMCLRLIGVSEQDFLSQAFNSDHGCSTFLIDVAWSDVRAVLGLPERFSPSPLALGRWTEALEDWRPHWWIVIEYIKQRKITRSYAYELFTDAEPPTYMTVKSLSFVSGPALTAPALSKSIPSIASRQNFHILAFHVGQGMCSLVQGGTDGILLDVGAGTPVTRAAYQANTNQSIFNNDLESRTQALTALQAVISHPDSDHWRVLDWDQRLRNQVSDIFTPLNTASLGLKSKHVIKNVQAIGNSTVTNGPGGPPVLKLHRSAPWHSDRNGECLVVEAVCNGRVLFPGDYVYDRFAKDGNLDIKALASSSFDAVVVPHHGDAASGLSVVKASSSTSKAFFSAGNHAMYQHPRQTSMTAHKSAGFKNISRQLGKPLVPPKTASQVKDINEVSLP